MRARGLALLSMVLCTSSTLGCGDDSAADGSGTGASTGDVTASSATVGGTPASTAVDDGSTASTAADATMTGEGPSSTQGTSADGTSTGEPGEDCIVHVDAATGNDASFGFSWLSAKRTLVAGLELAARWDCEVWIAAGTYQPSELDDPAASFTLFTGAQVYGGFAGDEASLDERDVATNPTVLSGDLGVAGLADDNSLHVVLGADGARLDGVSVTGGYARDPLAGIDGAGLLVTEGSMTVANCTFFDNRTGDAPPPDFGTIGVYGGAGAGIAFFGQDLVIEGCSLHDNRTGTGSDGTAIGGDGGRGAGVAFVGTSLLVAGSVFTNNLTGDSGAGGSVGGAGGPGAGLYFLGDQLRVEGSTFVANATGTGGEAGNAGGSGGAGAAIDALGGTIEILDSEFTANATGPGGFAAVGGGGGLGGALSIESNDALVVAGCTFEGNACGLGGPGSNLDGGAGLGGAVFVRGDVGEVLLAHDVFIGNTAGSAMTGDGGGGALALFPSSPAQPQGGTTIVGNVLAGNSGGVGGAAFLRTKGAAPLDLVGNAFGDNAAIDGGALFFQSLSIEGNVDATLTNSILWGDPSSADRELAISAGFVGDPFVSLVVSSSIVDGGCVEVPALVCGPGIMVADPQYADPALGDLHALGAAGVDQGDDAAVPADRLDLDGDGDLLEPWSLDLDGNPRVTGVAVDLGAYESP